MAQVDLLAAYLMVGADDLKREFVLKRLTARVATLGDLDFNKDVFEGSGATADDVVGSCNMVPFMSECRMVVVKDVDKASKSTQEALVAYLDNPNPTTVLALTATKLAKNTRLYKAVAKLDKKAVIPCEPKKAKELPAQVRDFALSHRMTMTQRVAEELIEMVGDSTVRLDTEIAKLATALGEGTEITSSHLHQYITRTSEVKSWHVIDAVCNRNATQAAQLFALANDGKPPFGLLTSMVYRLRELLVAKELAGYRDQGALARELGMPDWRVRNHFSWAAKYSQEELEHALVSAAELECSMKSGADPIVAFETWMLELCSGGAARS